MIIDKDNIKLILIILVVSLGIGYAYINSDLNINGTAKIKNANWDVHWANVQIKSGSVTGENVVTAPTIQNQTTVNFSVVLPTPGSYYEFTVDAVNAGVIDAMIDTIDSKLNGATITTLPDYLSYEVTYSDGAELEQNHLLAANTTETYKVKIKYRDDIELNQIPASDQTLSLSFTVTYRQSTSSATEVDHGTTVYTISSTSSYMGQSIPNDITQYSSPQAAITAFSNRPFYLKHKLNEGVITESYVEFMITPEVARANSGMTIGTYAMRGSGATLSYNSAYDEYFYVGDSPYHVNNSNIIVAAFGDDNCNVYGSYSYCYVGGWNVHTYDNGYVLVEFDGWRCEVQADGLSKCSYDN